MREGGIYPGGGTTTVSLGKGCLLVNSEKTGHCDADEVEVRLPVGRIRLAIDQGGGCVSRGVAIEVVVDLEEGVEVRADGTQERRTDR